MARPHIEPYCELNEGWKKLDLRGFPRGSEYKVLSLDRDTGACSLKMRLQPGYRRPPGLSYSDIELFVLEGDVTIGERTYGEGQYIFQPAGLAMGAMSGMAGAMEATACGIRAISMSQLFTRGQEVRWATAERYGPAIVRHLLSIPTPPGVFHNVNYPDADPDQVKGVRAVRQGNWGSIHLGVDHRIDARNFPYAWLSFIHETGEQPEDTDVGAVHRHWISVTPLHTDITHHASLERLGTALAGIDLG